MIGILLFVGFLTLLYFYAIKPFNYWANKNVPTGKIMPFFGDAFHRSLGKESMGDFIQRLYKKLPNARYVGCYQLKMPLILLRSPELIKQICVKDFDHCLNHRNQFPAKDELWSKNLLILKGQTWKNMRSTLSPSFTSSKMKLMFHFICQNADLFVKHFLNKNDKIIEVEVKDAYRRYTNDVIANAAFGIQVDSLENRDNEFYEMGNDTLSVDISKRLKLAIFIFLPKIAEIFKLTFFGEKVTNFFTNLVKDTIKMRKENNISRTDMLGLLMEVRDGIERENTSKEIEDTSFAATEEHLQINNNNNKSNLTDTDIASQAFIFFFAGFETVSSTMCFMAQELAENPDIQKRLAEEIDENRPVKGAPSYETIMKMTYLDMVVSEALRKWPVAIATDRVVTKPYTIKPELPEEKPVHLDIDDNIFVPIHAIHHDPQYYENPEKFDPERFSPGNKKNIMPYTYMPFGVGPRNCIGSRFALLEIKVLFFYLLSHFEIVPVEKTNIPLIISKSAPTFTSENGFPLGLKRRN